MKDALTTIIVRTDETYRTSLDSAHIVPCVGAHFAHKTSWDTTALQVTRATLLLLYEFAAIEE